MYSVIVKVRHWLLIIVIFFGITQRLSADPKPVEEQKPKRGPKYAVAKAVKLFEKVTGQAKLEKMLEKSFNDKSLEDCGKMTETDLKELCETIPDTGVAIWKRKHVFTKVFCEREIKIVTKHVSTPLRLKLVSCHEYTENSKGKKKGMGPERQMFVMREKTGGTHFYFEGKYMNQNNIRVVKRYKVTNGKKCNGKPCKETKPEPNTLQDLQYNSESKNEIN